MENLAEGLEEQMLQILCRWNRLNMDFSDKISWLLYYNMISLNMKTPKWLIWIMKALIQPICRRNLLEYSKFSDDDICRYLINLNRLNMDFCDKISWLLNYKIILLKKTPKRLFWTMKNLEQLTCRTNLLKCCCKFSVDDIIEDIWWISTCLKYEIMNWC